MPYAFTRARLLALAVATCGVVASACSTASDDAPGMQVGNTCAAGTMCTPAPAGHNAMAGAGGSAAGTMPDTPSENVPTGSLGGASGAAGSAGSVSAPAAGTGADMQADASTPVDMPPPTRSSGCGADDWPASGNQTIDVGGTPRDYIVKIPDAYDTSKPYKLVFAWHGLGGTAAQIASGFRGGYYGLETRAAGSTIFVAGQGLETSSGGAGWPNSGGRDIAFVRAMLDWLRSSYCIDEERIFSVGMSYGGIMSNTIGCQLGDVFRAIAPMSGSGPRFFGGASSCLGQVAAWLSHGNMDTVVTFESGVASRDHWLESNHCTTEAVPVAPEGCVAYQGCDDGHPVHWCEFDGGHTVPAFASEAIWNFFSQF
jgi:polyhydroxybutyrate depolymerase